MLFVGSTLPWLCLFLWVGFLLAAWYVQQKMWANRRNPGHEPWWVQINPSNIIFTPQLLNENGRRYRRGMLLLYLMLLAAAVCFAIGFILSMKRPL